MTNQRHKEAVLLAKDYGIKYAAEVYDVHPRTVRKWRQKINKENCTFEVEDLPTGNLPIDKLIEDRIRRYNLKNDYMTPAE